MAKKSAKSKGFRKQTVKKPYLSKREIALLCVIVAALAVAAFFLFRYDDGALPVQDGVVTAEGDNWLIVNGSNVRGRARYFKLGEIGEIDGYVREKAAIATDANIPEYAFAPQTDDPTLPGITVTSSHSAANTLAKYASSTLTGLENTQIGEVQTAEFAGQPVSYFIYTTQYDVPDEVDVDTTAEAAEEADNADESSGEPNRFNKMLSGYLDASHESCVAIHVQSEAESEDALPTDEALTALLEQAVSTIQLESVE